MTDRYAFRLTAISLYALALAIFVSVSLLSVFHLLILIVFLLLIARKQLDIRNIPLSAWALIAYLGIQLMSATVNYSELEEKFRSIGVIKYPLIGILGLLIFRDQILQNNDFLKKHSKTAFYVFLATIPIAFYYGLTKVYSELGYFAIDLDKTLNTIENSRLSGFTDIMRYGYCSAISLLILFTITLNLNKFPKLNKKFLFITIVVGFVGLFLSYTRGAMLGFLICLPVIFFYFNKRLTAIITFVSFTIVSLMVIVSLLGGSDSSRFLMGSNSASNNIRMSQYLSAIHAFKERPILGYGPQQLKFHVKEIKQKYNLEYKDYHEHAHNVYLEIAANTGILGLIVFLSWLGLWFKELLTQQNTFAKQMFIPVILFLIIAGQFEMLLMAQTSTLIYFLYAISKHRIFLKETTT